MIRMGSQFATNEIRLIKRIMIKINTNNKG